MSILDRAALQDSPLADLHAIASTQSIDGYRRLRRPQLIDAILARQDGAEQADAPASSAAGDAGADRETLGEAVAQQLRAHDEGNLGTRRRRGRRVGRARASEREDVGDVREELRAHDEPESRDAEIADGDGAERQRAQPDDEVSHEEPRRDTAEETVEGVVELLANGSGFVRVNPPESSDDDVYISAAQIKRCELVPGDRVSGPRRPPRRSERFASMIRIDEINGRPADEVVDSTRYDELPTAFPQERLRLGSEDPTVKAIEWLTPFGRGSRVTIVGPPQAGKTEALRRLAAALSEQPGVHLSLVLSGVRPEEIVEWGHGAGTSTSPIEPASALSFDASADAQSQAVERVIDQGRRLASRGADAVILIDSLDGLHPGASRKSLGAARNIVDGGSLTVIATAAGPIGGETTVIALDRTLASSGRFPALDLTASWTMRPEQLVGEAGAQAILSTRAEALDS